MYFIWVLLSLRIQNLFSILRIDLLFFQKYNRIVSGILSLFLPSKCLQFQQLKIFVCIKIFFYRCYRFISYVFWPRCNSQHFNEFACIKWQCLCNIYTWCVLCECECECVFVGSFKNENQLRPSAVTAATTASSESVKKNEKRKESSISSSVNMQIERTITQQQNI